ncbi:MAG: ammonia channel protein [Flavobacteriaceae bacterium]|nr:MAG: ammonia channel protein [Flavobacteriaceae bacterium]
MTKKPYLPFLILIAIAIFGLFNANNDYIVSNNAEINTGDTAWMLTASAMVLLMTPGLAFFYGGMVNSKNVISTMLQSFIAMAVVSILWVVVGFSLAFGDSVQFGEYSGFIGDPRTHFFFKGVVNGEPWSLAATIPLAVFAFFQLKFAIITPALVTGAFAERIRFRSYVLFICLFSLLIYAPLCHWTWHPEGFLFKMGVLDFAGGTVVHMSAGIAALVGAAYMKKRVQNEKQEPANVPYVLLGTGLLWFGWFGFNSGSAFGANNLAASAFGTTNTASAAAGICWILLDGLRGKKPSALGYCIGAVVGLVAITPGAGFVTIPAAIFIGVVASIVSNIAISITEKSGLNDTLDVFACHGVGGIVGMILTGVFALNSVNGVVLENEQGLITGGGATLFCKHLMATGIVIAFVAVGTLIVLKLTDLISPLQVTAEEEELGMDITQHGEHFIGSKIEDKKGL